MAPCHHKDPSRKEAGGLEEEKGGVGQKWREITSATPLALREEEATSRGMQAVSRSQKR